MYKQGDTLIFYGEDGLYNAAIAARLWGKDALDTLTHSCRAEYDEDPNPPYWRQGFQHGTPWQVGQWRIVLDTPEKLGWFTAKAGDLVVWQRDGEPFRGIINNDDMTPDEYAALGLKPGVGRIIERNGKPFPVPQEVARKEPEFQTPEKFFSQYLDKGHIFPEPGLPVRLKDGSLKYVSVIAPKYADYLQPIHSHDERWYANGHLCSSDMACVMDIMAVLDAEGNIIAGWEKPTRYYTVQEQKINKVVLEDAKRNRELNERIKSKLAKQEIKAAEETVCLTNTCDT